MIPENLQTQPPVELQEANTISAHFLRIGTVVAMIMGNGFKSIAFEYRIPYVTLLAWMQGDRKSYYVRDIPCGSVLKLNQYLQMTQEHSVVLFVRNIYDAVSYTHLTLPTTD